MRKNLTYYIVAALLAGLLCIPDAKADWVHGYFTGRTGIDSLNRFLVIRDVEDGKLLGSQVVSLGDINGDAINDVLIWRSVYNYAADNPAFLFYGGNPPDGICQAIYPSIKSWTNVIGDINNDGYLDLGGLFADPIRWDINYGGPDIDDVVEFTFPDMHSKTARAADFDADGTLELVLSRSYRGGFVNIYRLDSLLDTVPEYIIPDTAAAFGQNLAVGDFNGDSFPDLAVAASQSWTSSFVKFYWGGPGFDTVPDFEIRADYSAIGWLMVPLGDFNGDGYGDIYLSSFMHGPYGIYWGGPDIDDKVDLIVNWKGGADFFVPTSADLAGDINSDGYPDLILGDDKDESVRIFLGGPTDNPTMFADIIVDSEMMPWNQIDFGKVVAGIGDFNGDGIDDFAVSSRTACFGPNTFGEVSFFAGYDLNAHNPNYVREITRPADFRLSQNYPNPFNPTTTIEFDLPRRSKVTLTIHSVLGQKVAGLLDGELAAGSYSIEWDGRSEAGTMQATGIYFYRLISDNHSATEKMLLLK